MDKQAEEYKTKGNEHFKSILYNLELEFDSAIEFYSKAVDCNISGKPMAIYLSNRAFCHIKMENYGLAIMDSEKAIEECPEYTKAYYRIADS